jgi:hypothetical protein
MEFIAAIIALKYQPSLTGDNNGLETGAQRTGQANGHLLQ